MSCTQYVVLFYDGPPYYNRYITKLAYKCIWCSNDVVEVVVRGGRQQEKYIDLKVLPPPQHASEDIQKTPPNQGTVCTPFVDIRVHLRSFFMTLYAYCYGRLGGTRTYPSSAWCGDRFSGRRYQARSKRGVEYVRSPRPFFSLGTVVPSSLDACALVHSLRVSAVQSCRVDPSRSSK